ncbi:MAG TPA: hypothetical protein VNW97_14390 [Candidatus Saccharimonadales bacterium]|jgi:hypothetical protein|nr:hypothetical protein [Candidatus Saccharimonadales bacterium]
MKTWNALIVCIVALGASLPAALAQEAKPGGEQPQTQAPAQNPTPNPDPNLRPSCPGSFPTDLTVTDCRFKIGKRFENFVNGSLTDQSIASAAFFGLVAQGLQTPGELKRTWDGYGRRVGVRYNQAVAKGSAQFLVGRILHDDPRHIRYYDEPGYIKQQANSVKFDRHAPWHRTWHAVFDSITVRQSSENGHGRRLPAFSRFAADYGGAYGGYAWYRGPENTFKKATLRATGSLGTELLSSFYTEFKPEVGRAMGAVFKRGRTKKK